MNQSGWQRAAVRDSARAITHVEPGQDLSGPEPTHWGKEELLEDSSCSLPSFLSFDLFFKTIYFCTTSQLWKIFEYNSVVLANVCNSVLSQSKHTTYNICSIAYVVIDLVPQ